MADTPDLQKVISVIMENPSIVAEISSLISGKKEEGSDEKQTAKEEPKKVSESASVSIPTVDSGKRNKLLYAMKPYLSEPRQNAVDTVITVLDVLHTMRGR